MITSTEIESIHGPANGKRLIFYVCTDHLGGRHNYGPLVTTDPGFNAEAFKTRVAAKVTEALAENEFNRMIEP